MFKKVINKKSLILTGLLAMASTSAFALTAPAAGDIMYPVFDLLVNQMINNGINYLVGFIGLCVAAYFVMNTKIMPALYCVIGAIMFMSAGTITTAFGQLF